MENRINVKDCRLYGLIALYDLHTNFYPKALEGITDEAAQSRLDTQANHMAWLAGSMLQERFELATGLGTAMEQKHHELFRNHQGIRNGATYPPLADFVEDWKHVSAVLREILLGLSVEKVDGFFEMDGWKMTHFDMISFNVYREANIIGQLVLWRRLLGYPAMKYDE